jgi:hypothetical protein
MPVRLRVADLLTAWCNRYFGRDFATDRTLARAIVSWALWASSNVERTGAVNGALDLVRVWLLLTYRRSHPMMVAHGRYD